MLATQLTFPLSCTTNIVFTGIAGAQRARLACAEEWSDLRTRLRFLSLFVQKVDICL